MFRMQRTLALACVLGFVSSLPPGLAHGGDWYKPFRILKQPFEAAQRDRPISGRDVAIEHLADEIDWLEHHIDAYGSIVAKAPDVWGETRLMRHRWEYERQMAAELAKFEVKMNAALVRSDQAFLGMAMALQAAATPEKLIAPSDMASAMSVSGALINDPTKADASLATVINRTKPFETPDGYKGFSFPDANRISLEPTTHLNQLSRYLNHLHELRRINEGDDTADSPGYSLNLVRIPISVLPGKKTREGYGAEITLIATPILGRELLPATFRNLVINDLVDLLAPVVVYAVNDPDVRDVLDAYNEKQPIEDGNGCERPKAANGQKKTAPKLPSRPPRKGPETPWKQSLAPKSSNELFEMIEAFAHTLIARKRLSTPSVRTRCAQMPLPPSQLVEVLGATGLSYLTLDVYRRLADHPANQPVIHYMDVRDHIAAELRAAWDSLATETGTGFWSCGALPHLAANIVEQRNWAVCDCREDFFATLKQLKKRCVGHAAQAGEFLESQAAAASLSPGLSFGAVVQQPLEPEPVPLSHASHFPAADQSKPTSSEFLAWAIMVESVLLNEQLKRDMKELASAKGVGDSAAEGLDFYGPNPSDPAREAFNEYVRCRWPIRVFALDPVTDEQNVADAFARRRELQIAMAVAFASGKLSAQGLMRFNRRLEWDMATIGLNRTAVGFSHGEDTFGWRFYPRFQTPPTKGNLVALWETTFGGPTEDQDLKKRRLESGIRECVAIVIMPSFLPYITLDTRTNWFKITNPKCTEISMQETMRLSRAVKTMQSSAATCAACAHLYRDGEVQRLLRRVAQLDRELPLQTLALQVPYENTLGGFAMFNHGITDMGPELVGWYGAPGVDPVGQTTLFLVGDRFSVLDTQLIAGGRPADFHLISRQVMQVTVPPGPQVLSQGEVDLVDFHLAAPYGVSSHLLIPVAPKAATLTGGGFAWLPGECMNFWYTVSADEPVTIDPYSEANLPHLAIAVPPTSGLASPITVRVHLFDGVDAASRAFVGTVEADFDFDARASVLFLNGKKFTALRTAIGTALQEYLRTKHPQGAAKPFTAEGELAPTNGPLIKVGGSVTVNLNKRE